VLGISGTELVLILFFGFLIFGPEKLPQMGRTVGRAIRQFRSASESMSQKIKDDVVDPFQEAVEPLKEKVGASDIQEDLNAINQTFKETQQALTDPFKDVLNFDGSSSSKTQTAEAAAKTGAVIAGGSALRDGGGRIIANKKQPVPEPEAATEPVAADDPFADAFAEAENSEPTPAAGAPAAKPTKKSMAASLYDLDDEDAPGDGGDA
jgi:sec-independent protein translocase protein TatB